MCCVNTWIFDMGCWLLFCSFLVSKKVSFNTNTSLTSLCHRLSQEIQKNLKIKQIVKIKYFYLFKLQFFRLYIADRQDAETCDLLCHNYVKILSFKTYSDLWIIVTKNTTQTISFNYMKCNEAMRQLNMSRQLHNISVF